MKKAAVFILVLVSFQLRAQKPFKIKEKNYNSDGFVIDNKGDLYTGDAKEVLKVGFLKNDGYLAGKVNKGDISGVWKYYNKKKLVGYHVYENNGQITYAFDKDGKLNWIEVYNKKESLTEIKPNSKGEVEKLYIIEYKNDGSNKNTFEYEKNDGGYFDATIADYDYNTLTVLDYFENDQGEQEIVIRDFDKHHELIRLISNDHHVKSIFFLGDILEKPEDADYRLEKGFNASFTELKDKDNFKLTLLKGKAPVFEVFVSGGEITKIDKRLQGESKLLIYTKEKGYIPQEHKKADELIERINQDISVFLKNKK